MQGASLLEVALKYEYSAAVSNKWKFFDEKLGHVSIPT
jgi:hypothetical protein